MKQRSITKRKIRTQELLLSTSSKGPVVLIIQDGKAMISVPGMPVQEPTLIDIAMVLTVVACLEYRVDVINSWFKLVEEKTDDD